MFGRRMVILVAVLMGLMVLAASVAPPPPTPREPGGTPSPAASPSAAPGPAATATPASGSSVRASGGTSPVATLDVAHGRDSVTVRKGALFTLNVVANAIGSVEVVGLDYVGAIDPSTPARLQIDADRTGQFPVRLIEGGRPLGELVVTARG